MYLAGTLRHTRDAIQPVGLELTYAMPMYRCAVEVFCKIIVHSDAYI